MQRDFMILLALVALLYAINQFSSVDVTSGIENTFTNQYQLDNQCNGDIVIVNSGNNKEITRIVAGESGNYNPPSTAMMQLQFEDGETGWFPLKIEGSDIEISGKMIPAESDIFGRNPHLTTCP
ncbi:MAG: hypothetical protein ACPG8W_06945 [Candidatus Promineifilaceae bacterium]